MIPQKGGISSLESGAAVGLLRAAKCLCEEMDDFRKTPPESIEEDIFWQQCERRCQEVEAYRDMIPEEIADLIMTHAIRSHDLKIEQLSEADRRQK